MGNTSTDYFMDKVGKIINWAGNLIAGIVSWFVGQIRAIVENAVKKFIKSVKDLLQKAKDFVNTLKTVVIQKMIEELNKQAQELKKDLSKHDQDLVNEILSQNTCPIK